jgi:hypothetical protein
MIETWRRGRGEARPAKTTDADQAVGTRSPRLRNVVLIGLLGMLVLSPVQFVVLPLNLSLVELWNAFFVPVSWLYLIQARQPIRMPFAVAMWFILVGSFVGTLAAPNPIASLVAILKDVYLYSWFVTVALLLVSFSDKYFRWVLLSWLGVVVVHGVLVVAQFLSVDVFRITADFAARFGALDCCRPSGLFENANSTALFQLMGFAPLLLVRPSKVVALILGALILISIIATGSLAATAGFLVGLTVAVIAIPIANGNLRPLIRIFAQLALAMALLGGLFYFTIAQNPDLSARLAAIFYGRATGSAEGRFSIWQRGIDLLGADKLVWGIGPDSYQYVDLLQAPLHNDLLAFLVERGIIGTLGLVLLAALAVSQAIRLVSISKQQAVVGVSAVICLAALAGAGVHGQFHQVFHHRSVWLLLAVQEAVLVKMMTFAQASPPMSLPNEPNVVRLQVARR